MNLITAISHVAGGSMPDRDSRLAQLAHDWLPSGSGIDSGCTIDPASQRDRIIIHGDYHHMDENGCYCGWSSFTVTARPDWNGPDIRIVCHGDHLALRGDDRTYHKDMLHDVFSTCLEETSGLWWDPDAEKYVQKQRSLQDLETDVILAQNRLKAEKERLAG